MEYPSVWPSLADRGIAEGFALDGVRLPAFPADHALVAIWTRLFTPGALCSLSVLDEVKNNLSTTVLQ